MIIPYPFINHVRFSLNPTYRHFQSIQFSAKPALNCIATGVARCAFQYVCCRQPKLYWPEPCSGVHGSGLNSNFQSLSFLHSMDTSYNLKSVFFTNDFRYRYTVSNHLSNISTSFKAAYRRGFHRIIHDRSLCFTVHIAIIHHATVIPHNTCT